MCIPDGPGPGGVPSGGGGGMKHWFSGQGVWSQGGGGGGYGGAGVGAGIGGGGNAKMDDKQSTLSRQVSTLFAGRRQED